LEDRDNVIAEDVRRMRDGVIVCPVDMDGGRIRFLGSAEWIHPPEPIWSHTKYSMPFEGALAFMKMGYAVRRSCWPENDVLLLWGGGRVSGLKDTVSPCLIYSTSDGSRTWTPGTDDIFAGDWVAARRL